MTIDADRSSETAGPQVEPSAQGRRSSHGAALTRTAWTLGLAGLTPFVLMAAVLAWAGRDFIAFGQLVLGLSGYSAAILSFLGGIRWGFALSPQHQRRRVLVVSVLSSLAGWILLFVPSPWAFAGFAAAFALQGAWDAASARSGHLPGWFGRLRLVLTVVVVLCQLAAFAAIYA
ncbi:DUF3429 domain-containing protein [Aurantimonas sp. VKM B-3413]|uniref:DUF3429 domain-containing protein n=1 Tax=Aurantimonas sp. VKM B-3413 TaxID=2779401 RepID=UPI001E370F0A|nr:DUF3429 domain-containing protein [Aurantimonas sp. VKM B-3413]MCB8835981.1 DUF3429 domain-containing protein [Aurantimonas sp. VKM B-3413]